MISICTYLTKAHVNVEQRLLQSLHNSLLDTTYLVTHSVHSRNTVRETRLLRQCREILDDISVATTNMIIPAVKHTPDTKGCSRVRHPFQYVRNLII